MSTDTLLSMDEILAQKQLFERELIQGIYFLIKDGEIVYVGQSTRSVYDRIFAHFRAEKKHFDSYTILRSDEEDLNDLEAAYIFMCAPMYNYTIPSRRYLPMGRKLKAQLNYDTAPKLKRRLRELHIYPNQNGYYDTQEIEEAFAKETENDG